MISLIEERELGVWDANLIRFCRTECSKERLTIEHFGDMLCGTLWRISLCLQVLIDTGQHILLRKLPEAERRIT